jgi:hypothetical protein
VDCAEFQTASTENVATVAITSEVRTAVRVVLLGAENYEALNRIFGW